MRSLIRTLGSRLRMEPEQPDGPGPTGRNEAPPDAGELSAADLLERVPVRRQGRAPARESGGLPGSPEPKKTLGETAQVKETQSRLDRANELIGAADRARDTRE